MFDSIANVPRLELRWRKRPSYWLCTYWLIWPCKDCRQKRHTGHTWVKLGDTKVTPGRNMWAPVTEHGVDTPFRDGCHIAWDAHAFQMPAYAIWGRLVTRLEPQAAP